MNSNSTIEKFLFGVLVLLAIFAALAAYADNSPQQPHSKAHTPTVTVYEDFSGFIDYGDYRLAFADDNSKIEIWLAVGDYPQFACDALSLDEKWCILVGDDSKQEFAAYKGLW